MKFSQPLRQHSHTVTINSSQLLKFAHINKQDVYQDRPTQSLALMWRAEVGSVVLREWRFSHHTINDHDNKQFVASDDVAHETNSYCYSHGGAGCRVERVNATNVTLCETQQDIMCGLRRDDPLPARKGVLSLKVSINKNYTNKFSIEPMGVYMKKPGNTEYFDVKWFVDFYRIDNENYRADIDLRLIGGGFGMNVTIVSGIDDVRVGSNN
jgi:hypothetical protein